MASPDTPIPSIEGPILPVEKRGPESGNNGMFSPGPTPDRETGTLDARSQKGLDFLQKKHFQSGIAHGLPSPGATPEPTSAGGRRPEEQEQQGPASTQNEEAKGRGVHGLPSPRETPDPTGAKGQPTNNQGQQGADGPRGQGEKLQPPSGESPAAGQSQNPPSDKAGAETEVARITSCVPTDYAQIVGAEDDSEFERTLAWQRRGMMLHPKRCSLPGADIAYQRLKTAAEELNVDSRFISPLDLWDGVGDIEIVTQSMLDGDDASEGGGTGDRMDMDHQNGEAGGPRGTESLQQANIPVPPPWVAQIYERMTTVVQRLFTESNDTLRVALDEENGKIQKWVENFNNTQQDAASRVEPLQWTVDSQPFIIRYGRIRELAHNIINAPAGHKQAREQLESELLILREYVHRYHFPATWSPRSVEECIYVTVRAKHGFIYPWPTFLTEDGRLIVGCRKSGYGWQVCVESVEEGRLVRRTMGSSEAGLYDEVREYVATDDYKNLSNSGDGKQAWGPRDRINYVKLLWVTDSGQKFKGKTGANPAALCCVQMKNGLRTPNVSNLIKLLGKREAKRAITKVCEAHNIVAPWDAPGNEAAEDVGVATYLGQVESRRKKTAQRIPYPATAPNAPDDEGSSDPTSDHELLDSVVEQVQHLQTVVKNLTAGVRALEKSDADRTAQFDEIIALLKAASENKSSS